MIELKVDFDSKELLALAEKQIDGIKLKFICPACKRSFELALGEIKKKKTYRHSCGETFTFKIKS